MFKNKYLKQLRKVQSLIREYTASLEKLNPPKPHSHLVNVYFRDMLRKWLNDDTTDFCELFEGQTIYLENDVYEYLEEFGKYCVHIADNYNTKKLYNKELMRLKEEEHRLKEKLGIE